MNVALYARYSSDQQREASIEDRLALCRIYAERQGWRVSHEYTDPKITGATLLLRPGILTSFPILSSTFTQRTAETRGPRTHGDACW
jgi:hypothetical protein